MSGTLDHCNVSLKIDSLALSALDLQTAQDPILVSILSTLSNGTSTGQASAQFADTRTLSASATEDLDLAGSLTNAFGSTLTFTKIKLIYIKASAGNTNDVQVSRASSNGFVWFLAAADGFKLQPGAWVCFYDPVGVAVTAGTGDLLTMTNSAGSTSVGYDIVIVGTN